MATKCKCDCEEPMSPVRRTFCLLTLFDLVLSFLLWILYTQIKGLSPWQSFQDEVVHYNVHTSLFDLVLLAGVRFIFLILAYGLFRLHNPWVVAVTTTLSSGFLIAKVFLFSFSKEDRDSPLLDYLLVVSSFVLSWAETWFLDFKVLPRELKECLENLKRAATEASPLLYGGTSRYSALEEGPASTFYSPVGGSPENRSLAGDQAELISRRQLSVDAGVPSPLTPDQKKCLIERGQSTVSTVHDLLMRNGWKLEKQGKDQADVYSISDRKFGKIFRIECTVNALSDDMFADFYQRVKDMSKWNPAIRHSERVDILDDHTDVCYVCVKDQAGGMVSSRDFLDVRSFVKTTDELGNSYTIVSICCEHPRKPVLSEFVRGENGPNAWIIRPLLNGSDGRSRTKFICMLNTNLKGWIPQTAVDHTLSTILLDLIQNLQQKWANGSAC